MVMSPHNTVSAPAPILRKEWYEMPNFSTMKENDLLKYAQEVRTILSDDLTGYGKTSADLTALDALAADLQNKIVDKVAKHDAAKAATYIKQKSYEACSNSLKTFVLDILNDSAISDDRKNAIRLFPRTMARTLSAPGTPTDLQAVGFSDGTNKLRWKTGGNIAGTLYQIEARFGDSTSWALVGVVTARKFDHTGQTPGVVTRYRVKAKRHGDLSPSSNEAIVYG
jgi:hypothetical protein